MQKIYREIGARVRSLRKALKLTQAEVAERIGIDPSFYGQIERGANVPSLRTLFAIAAALKVEPSDLLPKSGEAAGADPLMTKSLGALLARLEPKKRRVLLSVVRDLADEFRS
ncbi:MAG: helix-turn-helix transcriptional regulator [Elusimicrobia bacterium]|nr:helix-turn-helix transcriptional regulator [Elusimicrobiota bacterium]MDE2510698.1 helix-turn-helix transcriptional regulator [Elusimicrobiota bacterium]